MWGQPGSTRSPTQMLTVRRSSTSSGIHSSALGRALDAVDRHAERRREQRQLVVDAGLDQHLPVGVGREPGESGHDAGQVGQVAGQEHVLGRHATSVRSHPIRVEVCLTSLQADVT
jgi:hypothetical protein